MFLYFICPSWKLKLGLKILGSNIIILLILCCWKVAWVVGYDLVLSIPNICINIHHVINCSSSYFIRSYFGIMQAWQLFLHSCNLLKYSNWQKGLYTLKCLSYNWQKTVKLRNLECSLRQTLQNHMVNYILQLTVILMDFVI